MNYDDSPEKSFTQDFRKLVDDKIDQKVNQVSQHVLEQLDYAELVGLIRGYRELKEEFNHLLKVYFPESK